MNVLKKWYFWVGIVLVTIIIIVVGYFAFAPKTKEEIVTEKVASGTLMQTVDADGELVSIDRVDLSFETSGTLQTANVKLDNQVKKGDVLFELSAPELKSDVERARQAVAIAQSQLDLKQYGAPSEQIAVYQADVAIAQANLDAAKTSYDNTVTQTAAAVAQAQIDVETKADNLDNVRADNELALVEAQADYISAMKSALVEVRSAISAADRVLGVENSMLNDDFQTTAEALSGSLWGTALSQMSQAIQKRNLAENKIFVLSSSSDVAAIETASKAAEDALNQSSVVLLSARQILDYLTIDTPQFTLSEVLALKTTLDTARNSLQSQESVFLTKKQAYDSADNNAKTSEDNASHALDLARETLAKAEADQISQVANAASNITLQQANLSRAQATLAQIKAPARNVDLAGLRADVSRAQADLQSAQAMLSKSQIVSPIDGRVTQINYEVGEQITAQAKVVTIQTIQDGQFKVVVDVSEADIAKVSLKDPVSITFDALGEDTIISGFVSEIDPAEIIIDGVVYYQVDVTLEGDIQQYDLRPGMTVNSTITTEVIENTLYVPQRAVLERDDGSRYVRVPRAWGGYDERDVEIGLRGDNGRLQIISGLKAGETIIVTIRQL